MTGSDKILEVSVGLTTQICKFIDCARFKAELRGAGSDERAYVERLTSILGELRYPEIRVPRMRRFVVQQAIWLMESSCGDCLALFRELGMQRLLEYIADTTSELECYHVFSGSVGIGKHRESFSGIVDNALELFAEGGYDGGGARAACSGIEFAGLRRTPSACWRPDLIELRSDGGAEARRGAGSRIPAWVCGWRRWRRMAREKWGRRSLRRPAALRGWRPVAARRFP